MKHMQYEKTRELTRQGITSYIEGDACKSRIGRSKLQRRENLKARGIRQGERKGREKKRRCDELYGVPTLR
jgi:hypothetical protein